MNEMKISKLTGKDRYSFEDLALVMRILRSEDGCPWDREQDHHSIRTCLIEETYEVAEAIDNNDAVLLREELGDLLFQIVFHAQIEQEAGIFSLDDVIHEVTAKMVHRHPHVFKDTSVESSGEVLVNWEKIKTEEKQRNSLAQKLRAIPPMMPALMRASKVGKKIEGGESPSVATILEQLETDLNHIKSSLTSNTEEQKAVIGSLLFHTTQLSRGLGIDAEHSLFQETERIICNIESKSL